MVKDGIREIKLLDPTLESLVPYAAQYEIRESVSLFQALLRSVIGQQLSTKVATVIWGRFLCLFPEEALAPKQIQQISDESYRSIGLSGQKTQYIRNISVYFSENEEMNWQNMEDQDILSELTKIKGVGEWTVQMLLIFTLKRPDVWPVKDLGIQQSFAHFFQENLTGKQLIAEMEARSQKWSPHRSTVSLALWKWKDLGYPKL